MKFQMTARVLCPDPFGTEPLVTPEYFHVSGTFRGHPDDCVDMRVRPAHVQESTLLSGIHRTAVTFVPPVLPLSLEQK